MDPSRPTRVRYRVLGFSCALAMITYLDRACLASAADSVVADLGLGSVADLNSAFAAFALAYALFDVPNGWLGDVFGPRSVLVRIVLWWSAFAALTGLVGMKVGGFVLGGVGTLTLVQFLFGMGEAGAFPNITRALHNWFPFQERGFTQGAVWMCGRLMGGLTPLVWTLLVAGVVLPQCDFLGGLSGVELRMTWRAVFWAFGLVGVAWVVLFALFFRNRPEECPKVNAAELAWIGGGAARVRPQRGPVPWRRIVTNRNLWFLGAMYACQSYGWWFYITYLPRFFGEHYAVSPSSLLGAVYKGGPLWMGALGCLLGGFLTDWYIRRTGNRRWGRRLFGATGHALTAVCFLACVWAPSAFWFFVLISLAGFSTDLTMASSWASCQDIGNRYAAIVAGFMNMIGNLGGALANWCFGWVLKLSIAAAAARFGVAASALPQADHAAASLHGYHVNFCISAAVYVVGVLCWLQIDSTKPIAEE
ncbi:MAG: MFS transporter [Thermoguttaceae bacterium]|jgi:MFS family permease